MKRVYVEKKSMNHDYLTRHHEKTAGLMDTEPGWEKWMVFQNPKMLCFHHVSPAEFTGHPVDLIHYYDTVYPPGLFSLGIFQLHTIVGQLSVSSSQFGHWNFASRGTLQWVFKWKVPYPGTTFSPWQMGTVGSSGGISAKEMWLRHDLPHSMDQVAWKILTLKIQSISRTIPLVCGNQLIFIKTMFKRNILGCLDSSVS